ncbi:MAG: hypothetical protein OQK54_07635 [Gammaproteobacteria bacterium]|nr:hypothetical protein [Gammaproteobacteria bacterium]
MTAHSLEYLALDVALRKTLEQNELSVHCHRRDPRCILQQHECDLIQGFCYSAAFDVGQFTERYLLAAGGQAG